MEFNYLFFASDYGIDNSNPETIPRGPKFTVQPQDTVHEISAVNKYTSLYCEADAYPPAEYKWFKERGGEIEAIDPEQDERYLWLSGWLVDWLIEWLIDWLLTYSCPPAQQSTSGSKREEGLAKPIDP